MAGTAAAAACKEPMGVALVGMPQHKPISRPASAGGAGGLGGIGKAPASSKLKPMEGPPCWEAGPGDQNTDTVKPASILAAPSEAPPDSKMAPELSPAAPDVISIAKE